MADGRDVGGGRGADEIPALRRLLLILRRRRRILVAAWILTVALGAGWVLSTTPLYRPQATLEIRPESPVLSTDGQDPALLASRTLWENYYRTQEAILTSASLHADVLASLPDELRAEYAAQKDPLRAFARQVRVEPVRSSFILKVGFVDADPRKATQIVNVLVSRYLEEVNRRLRERRAGTAEMLAKAALPAIRQGVEDAERALQEFLARNRFLPPQDQYAALLESQRSLMERLTRIRLSRIETRARLKALEGAAEGRKGGAFNPAFSSRNLEALIARQEEVESELARRREELLEEHPAVIALREQQVRLSAKIQDALRAMLEALAAQLEAAEEEERAVQGELAEVERKLGHVVRQVSEYKRLDAQLAGARELYAAYLKRQGETEATSGTGLASVRVLDPAQIPSKPYAPDVAVVVSVAFVLGAFLGLGAVFLAEQLDDSIRSASEVQGFLGLDVVGAVPPLRSAEGPADGPRILSDRSALSEVEPFRVLRSELVARLEGVRGGRMVAVLSALRGEGKSTVAANLARALAMEGRKVLLLDADMRRPTAMRTAGPEAGPAMEHFLRGEVPFEQAVRREVLAGVDVFGMTAGTNQAAELAGSEVFEDALRRAREAYEYVVVDTPPVLQAAEAALLARRCDAAVLVARARRTGRAAARSALRRLTGARAPVVGAILNEVAVPSAAEAEGYYGYGLACEAEGAVGGA
ncbi:MAG TPA: polysaccharide biosynthesis tyrosine autokinase [Planctomycetota bacterium]|nr:polysaccharide biosynthesis tyrosine autokinase [Planctomycetota bacterium]